MSANLFNLRFDGRCVLITGGSGGLGAPASEAFAAAGAKVVILDRNKDAGQSLAARIAAQGEGEAEFVAQDLRDLAETVAAVERIVADQTVDILVNNAAIYPSKALSEFSIEEYEDVQRVNATAAFALSKAVLPGMAAQGWGRIINISSITFSGGWSNLAPYVVSKGALIGLTRAIAREYGALGVTANAICPGAFPTEAERIHSDPEGYQKFVLEHQAIKRRGTPADVVFALLMLASEASGFITGQALNVDGGWLMQ